EPRIDALPRLRGQKTASFAKADSRKLLSLLPDQRTRKSRRNRLFRPWRTNKIGNGAAKGNLRQDPSITGPETLASLFKSVPVTEESLCARVFGTRTIA